MAILHLGSGADDGVRQLGEAATFDYQAGDVGYVPRGMPHYVENTGTSTMRFLETFRSDHYEDHSMRSWLALTPHELVRGHLRIDESVLAGIGPRRTPVLPP
jgi:oxalate decarboxylase